MRQLLVDIGNSRLKFATLTGRELGRMHAIAHGGSASAMLRGLASALRGTSSVTAVSVSGKRLERAFAHVVERASGLEVQFVRSTTALPPLINGYQESWRLGADRWVAIAGAYALLKGRRDAVVVDAGTALTVDLVRRDGQHLGGVIVPGPDLMVSSLLSKTRGIRVRAQGQAPSRRARRPAERSFGRSTREAIDWGSELAAAALIERLTRDASRRLRRTPLVLLTGGAAERLAPRVTIPARVVPDLVLQGLAQFALRPSPTR
jgi:type III pantothenate kinase